MAPPTGSTRTSTSGASSAARRANDSAGSRRASRVPVETDHAVRAPVNRDRHTRSQQAERLHRANRVEVAPPHPGAPPGDGQEGNIEVRGERAHAREEVGVAWEVQARRAGDEIADRRGGGAEEIAVARVLRMGGSNRQGADTRLFAFLDLQDPFEATHHAGRAPGHDQRDRPPEAPERRRVEMVVVSVRDGHRVDVA